MKLYNLVHGKVLRESLKDSTKPRTTLSFYCYHGIENPRLFRDELYLSFASLDVLGRIYIAPEGINAQVSLPEDKIAEFKGLLDQISFLRNVRLNLAIEDNGKSFFKLKILVRKKIVADGISDESFDPSNSGAHLTAKEFNVLTDDPETVVVDMRNHYESEIGHFKNAVCLDADTFRDALPMAENLLKEKKDKNIVMYCTGGIRCEKASAWMKHRGFKNVFQLDGGIIEYARQVNSHELENKFIGKNFVFDERLGERITHEVIGACHQCGTPCDTHTNCKNDACHLLFIQCPACSQRFNGCCSKECLGIISLPAESQKILRQGKAQGRMVFKKGRVLGIRLNHTE
jgi:UPF0176 protein